MKSAPITLLIYYATIRAISQNTISPSTDGAMLALRLVDGVLCSTVINCSTSVCGRYIPVGLFKQRVFGHFPSQSARTQHVALVVVQFRYHQLHLAPHVVEHMLFKRFLRRHYQPVAGM